MNPLTRLVRAVSKRARQKRARMFRDAFVFTDQTRILDLGSEDGSNIAAALAGTAVRPEHVYIADIDADHVQRGHEAYGFVPVVVDESEPLPFEDGFFDIVYCSSVIEHVTLPKNEVWQVTSGREFRETALRRQREFANDIRRLGTQYFVQTPYRHFPVESHSWLPFIAWLPRRVLLPVLRITNKLWIKATDPDWYLLDRKEMKDLFDDAELLAERSLGLTKSLIAVRRTAQSAG